LNNSLKYLYPCITPIASPTQTFLGITFCLSSRT